MNPIGEKLRQEVTRTLRTILCFPASLIQRMLSLYCCLTPSVTLTPISSRTVAAILSVTTRSCGSPDVHTQRNGPKPKEKMSLWKEKVSSLEEETISHKKSHKKEKISPHDVLHVRRKSKLCGSSTRLLYVSS